VQGTAQREFLKLQRTNGLPPALSRFASSWEEGRSGVANRQAIEVTTAREDSRPTKMQASFLFDLVSFNRATFRRMSENIIAPNPWMMLPFVLLLGAMAFAPSFAGNWWSRHYPKVALGLGVITLGYYLLVLGASDRVLHVAHDYVCFIMLVGSLFVVSGGIHINVKGEATPLANVMFLLVGAVLANFLGTTGAAMLLIRPWIRMNKYRVTAHHIVFFIFIVANVGGCLTPIGDPPLFLGYLQGVPFWWVAEHCWPMWATGIGLLLAMFYVVDRVNFGRAPREIRQMETTHETWKFDGLVNLFFLAMILGAVFINKPVFLREAVMLAAALGSYFTTARSVHEANRFHFHPIREVAILFIGIFATMIPVLDWLGANARELLGQNPAPGIFYFSTGMLSGVLDNAPTYLSFLSALFGTSGANGMGELLSGNALNLVAISVGAVFFGAATYIGNGPNFMVKAMADHEKIHTPTFPGFVLKFTLPFLLPVLAAVWLIFF
jgi:Na+/H+ antiporter NhaD/arsenite permease-like protein